MSANGRPGRRDTLTVHVDGIPVGGGHAIVIQSMTNTDTADVAATVRRCVTWRMPGSELVRITVNSARPPRPWRRCGARSRRLRCR
jgi:4-hydroxy-3-methylbut-2-en-1-yl diphosphate synthase IspG/GcpE